MLVNRKILSITHRSRGKGNLRYYSSLERDLEFNLELSINRRVSYEESNERAKK